MVALSACQQSALPPVVFTGRNVEVGVAEGLRVCGGTFEYMDTHVDALWNALRLAPRGGPFRFSYMDPQQVEVVAPCLGEACATTDHVYSSIIPWNHEHVHVVRQRVFGSPLPLPAAFEEGLAELYGDGRHVGVSDVSLAELVERDGISGSSAYLRAGHAVSVLVDQYGIEAVNTVSMRAPSAGFEEAFEATLETPLDAFVADYEQQPQCQQLRWRRPLLECGGTPVPWLDGQLRVDMVAACDDPATIGPRGGMMWTYRTIEIEQTGSHAIAVGGDLDEGVGSLWLTGCDGGCEGTTMHSLQAGEQVLWLEAGRYYLMLERDVAEPGAITLIAKPR